MLFANHEIYFHLVSLEAGGKSQCNSFGNCMRVKFIQKSHASLVYHFWKRPCFPAKKAYIVGNGDQPIWVHCSSLASRNIIHEWEIETHSVPIEALQVNWSFCRILSSIFFFNFPLGLHSMIRLNHPSERHVLASFIAMSLLLLLHPAIPFIYGYQYFL